MSILAIVALEVFEYRDGLLFDRLKYVDMGGNVFFPFLKWEYNDNLEFKTVHLNGFCFYSSRVYPILEAVYVLCAHSRGDVWNILKSLLTECASIHIP